MGQATTVEALEKARNDVQRIENKVTAAEQLKGAGPRLVDVGVALMAVSNGENRHRLEAMFSERAQAQAMQVMQAQLVTEEDRKAFAAIAQISNNVCIQREQAERTLASDDFAGRREFAYGTYAASGAQYAEAIQNFINLQKQQVKAWMDVADA